MSTSPAHTCGATGACYRTAIENTDRHIGTLLDGIRSRPTYAHEDWTFIFTTDHGHTDAGGHGGSIPRSGRRSSSNTVPASHRPRRRSSRRTSTSPRPCSPTSASRSTRLGGSTARCSARSRTICSTRLLEGGVDGLVIATRLDLRTSPETEDWLRSIPVPVVLAERRVGRNSGSVEQVATDHEFGAYTAERHLAASATAGSVCCTPRRSRHPGCARASRRPCRSSVSRSARPMFRGLSTKTARQPSTRRQRH